MKISRLEEQSVNHSGFIMKKLIVSVALCVLLSGCSKKIDYSLPKNPVKYDLENCYDGCARAHFTCSGRFYTLFGYTDSNLDAKYAEGCVGYLWDKHESFGKHVRIVKLKDPNYLLPYNVDMGTHIPEIWRAEDTKDGFIDIPEWIEEGDFEFWGGSNSMDIKVLMPDYFQ